MKISTTVSRVFHVGKRGLLITLAALLLTSVAVPPSVLAKQPTAHQSGPLDGTGDNPQMP